MIPLAILLLALATPAWLYPDAPVPVATGLACAGCHGAGGSGASLAGLPADYIIAQVAAFRDGSRSGDWHPTQAMAAAARAASETQVQEAAARYSRMRFTSHLRVIESPETADRIIETGDTALVPPGSLARGAVLAENNGCLECHSGALNNWGAGRSPLYILRQLHAFRGGTRTGPAAEPMQAVAAMLSPAEMIDVAAYMAAQTP